MRVLILGATGYLGPHVVKALENEYVLRLTDIKESSWEEHEYLQVDVSDPEQVLRAAEGMDAIINLSVLRWDPEQAFDVNTRGTYNVLTAAQTHGIRRIINTESSLLEMGPRSGGLLMRPGIYRVQNSSK